MKTMVEMPDALFRQAKAKAPLQGKSMKQFVNEAVQQKVEKTSEENKAQPNWMKGFGVIKKYPGAREELWQVGRPIPHNDLWIATLARQHHLPIVSRDVHFDKVKKVKRYGW